MPSAGSGLSMPVVLSFLGVCLAAVLSFFAARGMRTAPLQEAVNSALRLLMEQLQAKVLDLQQELARRDALVATLEQQNELLQDQLGDASRDRLELTGRIRNLEHSNASQLRLLMKAGVSPIPPDSRLIGGRDDEPA